MMPHSGRWKVFKKDRTIDCSFTVIILGEGNPQYQSRLENEGMESHTEKDLGVLVV